MNLCISINACEFKNKINMIQAIEKDFSVILKFHVDESRLVFLRSLSDERLGVSFELNIISKGVDYTALAEPFYVPLVFFTTILSFHHFENNEILYLTLSSNQRGNGSVQLNSCSLPSYTIQSINPTCLDKKSFLPLAPSTSVQLKTEYSRLKKAVEFIDNFLDSKSSKSLQYIRISKLNNFLLLMSCNGSTAGYTDVGNFEDEKLNFKDFCVEPKALLTAIGVFKNDKVIHLNFDSGFTLFSDNISLNVPNIDASYPEIKKYLNLSEDKEYFKINIAAKDLYSKLKKEQAENLFISTVSSEVFLSVGTKDLVEKELFCIGAVNPESTDTTIILSLSKVLSILSLFKSKERLIKLMFSADKKTPVHFFNDTKKCILGTIYN